jgi:hypothetical protein
MNKKAQIMGQVFIFILAALLFILILTYGYKAIAGFGERSEQVALIEFQSKLENSVKSMKSDFGSVRKLDLQLPAKYSEICIVGDMTDGQATNFEMEHPRMYDAWLGGSQNVFLNPMSETPIDVGDISVSEGYLCTGIAGGTVVLKIEGLGRKTGISKWAG